MGRNPKDVPIVSNETASTENDYEYRRRLQEGEEEASEEGTSCDHRKSCAHGGTTDANLLQQAACDLLARDQSHPPDRLHDAVIRDDE
jgi:hypothetical protein